MALGKDKILDTGITASYHKITDVSATSIIVEVYKDGTARGAGSKPVTGMNYPIDGFTEDELKLEGNSPLVLAYEYLKTLDDYSDATDV